MDLNSIPLLNAITQRMSWLGARQAVLAENVANADTPGYAARDIPEPDFKRLLAASDSSIAMRRTRPRHLAGTAGEARLTQSSLKPGKVGTVVSIEEQMMEVGRTRMDYDAMVSIYRKQVHLIKMAVRGLGR